MNPRRVKSLSKEDGVIIRNSLFVVALLVAFALCFTARPAHSEGSDPQAEQALESTGTQEPQGMVQVPGSEEERPPYEAKGKRDPFQPFIKLVEEDTKVSQKPSEMVPPIKKYPVQEFRLVGVMWVGDEPRAIVVDPEKNTYFLELGDEIGNKNGRIAEIRENGILVEERTYTEDVFGTVKEKRMKTVLAFVE